MKTRNLYITLLLIAIAWPAKSQVTFRLESIPSYTPEAGPIYIAGTMNGWNPGDAAFALHKNPAGTWEITLSAMNPGSQIQFKFTRGSWATVEKGAGGEEISNRSYSFSIPDTVEITIHNWADNNGTATTAAANVTKISTAFSMPQLGRTRRVWLYLPPGYETSAKSYPVLYMHDGQNVFDSYTSFAGEWGVDETLNTLAAEGFEVPIVVAIDNGGNNRMNEYSPWHNDNYGGGEGDLYIDFITNSLKPFVDSAYRTKPGRESTGIMGSSMGGLISWYGAFKRPDIFGIAGIFSPSYWFSTEIWNYLRQAEKIHPTRLYQLVGGAEGGTMTSDMLAMQDTLLNIGYTTNELKSKVVPGAGHNESFWRSEFREAFLWLYPAISGINTTGMPAGTLKVFPNPVKDMLYLTIPEAKGISGVQIYSVTGACVASYSNPKQNRIGCGTLPSGKYLVKVSGDGFSYSAWFIRE